MMVGQLSEGVNTDGLSGLDTHGRGAEGFLFFPACSMRLATMEITATIIHIQSIVGLLYFFVSPTSSVPGLSCPILPMDSLIPVSAWRF